LKIKIKVISSNGRVILNDSTLDDTKEVDLSDLPFGLYILQIEIQGNTYYKKILKA